MGFCISEGTVTSLLYTLFWRNIAGQKVGQRGKPADWQTDGFFGYFYKFGQENFEKKTYKRNPENKTCRKTIFCFETSSQTFCALVTFYY